mmetsp:Transcript_13873/g.32813  ORF Transcript_13873/g.32813 Transcript_13873/m.32813 type:complete len:129 (+) Transcript_13873:677-1063(+)
MQKAGVPIDGVGLQMHITVEGINASSVAENIQRFAAMGLEVHITEMDVKCPHPCDEARQARVYSEVLGACLQHAACKSFETWGYTDAHSWLEPDRKGIDENALPFDRQFHAKPAVTAMLQQLASNFSK